MPFDPEAEFERAASLASMDHESIRLDRCQDRTSRLGGVYPWCGQAVQDVLAGERSAYYILQRIGVNRHATTEGAGTTGGRVDGKVSAGHDRAGKSHPPQMISL